MWNWVAMFYLVLTLCAAASAVVTDDDGKLIISGIATIVFLALAILTYDPK